MKDIARKAFIQLDANFLLHHNLDGKKAEIVLQIIQSAIEEARKEWEKEYRARLRDSWRVQRHSDGTNRTPRQKADWNLVK